MSRHAYRRHDPAIRAGLFRDVHLLKHHARAVNKLNPEIDVFAVHTPYSWQNFWNLVLKNVLSTCASVAKYAIIKHAVAKRTAAKRAATKRAPMALHYISALKNNLCQRRAIRKTGFAQRGNAFWNCNTA